ncbi:hypothetical protein KEM48_003736 [Puccinia striiformis f. sp. tritici PST-130]|nr:hypothetical protein KEM48_003605 [Puccinia striiformis f. sp. tritici PST-130]KAI9613608.1 hypothetical protein KEM48_003736 [Puccinia striiformis f. sp. tritici PST-130]
MSIYTLTNIRNLKSTPRGGYVRGQCVKPAGGYDRGRVPNSTIPIFPTSIPYENHGYHPYIDRTNSFRKKENKPLINIYNTSIIG